MSRFFISLIFVLSLSQGFAQTEESLDTLPQVSQDSLYFPSKFGLRIGVDISKPIIQLIQRQDLGFEVTADYRISKSLYAATEVGYASEPIDESDYSFEVKGTFIRLGVNYNAYENWSGMNNEIYAGIRYGLSAYQQQRNFLNINDPQDYWGDYSDNEIIMMKQIPAHWIGIHFGLKVEVLNNLFLTSSVHLNKLINDAGTDGFPLLYIPGFSKVFLNKDSVSFNYTIAYLIPFKKKK